MPGNELFDIAKQEFGLEKTKVDFGQTLGKWGMAPGPYLILPFLPPAPTDACPECGSAQFRLVWKAVRHPGHASTASYVCDQCRHHWIGPATP